MNAGNLKQFPQLCAQKIVYYKARESMLKKNNFDTSKTELNIFNNISSQHE